MIDERRTSQKLDDLAATFRNHIRAKRYAQAKYCYDTARAVSVFMELEEEKRRELFGIQGDRGICLKEGMFPYDLVQKAYLETCVKSKKNPQECILCQNWLGTTVTE